MCCFTWAAARTQQLLFVVLAAGLWCFTAGCHVKSPLFPQPLSKSQTEVCSRLGESIRPSSTLPANKRTSYKFASPRYRLSCRLFSCRWANLACHKINGIARSLSRAVVIKTKSLPVSTTTLPTALSLYIAHDGRKHKHNPTLFAKKHVVQNCRSSLSAAADGLADGSGERRTSPVNGIERSLSMAVNPKTKSLPVSATTFPTALSLYIAQGSLRKDIRLLSKLFSKAEPLSFEKEMNLSSVYSSCLKHATKMLLGDPWRLTSERKASISQSSSINHSTLLLERSRAELLVVLHGLEHSTGSERVDAWGLRAVKVIICMITRDLSVITIDVTGVFLYCSQKVTHAQYRNRFRASYNKTKQTNKEKSTTSLVTQAAIRGPLLDHQLWTGSSSPFCTLTQFMQVIYWSMGKGDVPE